MKTKLTEKTLAAIALPAGKPQIIVWDSDLTGFGVVVGKLARTFIVEARVDGKKRRTKIGIAGRVRDDGHTWNVTRARIAAKEKLGAMAGGVDPHAEKRARRDGLTLRDGLELHLTKMEAKRRSPRSIATMRAEITKYLAAWLDEPLTDITGAKLAKAYQRIMTEAQPRNGSNPDNPKGAPLANRVRSHVSAIWNTANKRMEGKLGWNPAQSVDAHSLKPKRERIATEDLPGWYATVQTIAPVRRDLNLFMLFTGMRSDAARHVRWEHIDWKRGALTVPKPKGGESRAFELPLCKTLIDVLKRRQSENAMEFGTYGGDDGWCFPTRTRAKPFRVIPVAEAKEQKFVDGERVKILIGPHALRRTYESVAHEAGISELDLHCLTNHSFSSKDVNASYISQHFDHLAECAATIERALWARLEPGRKPKRKRR